MFFKFFCYILMMFADFKTILRPIQIFWSIVYSLLFCWGILILDYFFQVTCQYRKLHCGLISWQWFRSGEIWGLANSLMFSKGFRNSRPKMFLGKDFLKICGKFTGKGPCWSVISIKLFWLAASDYFQCIKRFVITCLQFFQNG